MNIKLTKICTKCKKNKPVDQYYTSKGNPRGDCKQCCIKINSKNQKKNKPWQDRDPEQQAQYMKTYRENNPEKIYELNRKFRENHPDYDKDYMEKKLND